MSRELCGLLVPALRRYSTEIFEVITGLAWLWTTFAEERLSLSSFTVATKPGAIASITVRMCSHWS